MGDVLNKEKAEALARALLSPRYHRLEQLERYVVGTQYDGLPDFFNPAADVPLLERAPNIVDSITEAAIRQHVDFALGEDHFPQITCAPTDDDRLLDGASALGDDDLALLDAFLRAIMEHAEFKAAACDAFVSAEGCGTAVSIVALRRGCPSIQSLAAKWCTPTFVAGELTSLEVMFPYIQLAQDERGRWVAEVHLYRRVIDANADTVYQPHPVRGERGMSTFTWTVDEAATVQHSLGFVPAVWYARKSLAADGASFDGHAIHETQLDELDALNFSLSQRGRAALYVGDPQMVEYGVSESTMPATTGRAAVRPLVDASGRQVHGNMPARADGVVPPSPRDHYVLGMSTPQRAARRKGPMQVWSYESSDAKVELLSLPGDALTSIDGHCKDLEQRISAVLGYTQSTPETIRGSLSGKALSLLFARTTSFCDGARGDFWSGWMRPTLQMLLRVVHRLGPAVYVAGAVAAQGILSRFVRTSSNGSVDWVGPRLRAVWPKYFSASTSEEKETVDLTATAFEAGLITREMALEKLKPIFPHQSSSELAKELEEHGVARQAARVATVSAENAAAMGPDDDEPESD